MTTEPEMVAGEETHAAETAVPQATETEVEAEQTEPDPLEDGSADEAGADATKKKDGIKKRFGELTRDREEARREAERERRRADELQRALLEIATKQQQGAEQDTQPGAPQAQPRYEDFQTEEAFLDALTEWKLERKLEERLAAQQKAQQEAQERQRVQTLEQQFKQRCDEFEATAAPGFWEKVKSTVPPGGYPPVALEAIAHSPEAPRILYYLASNPGHITELQRMTPVQQAAAIGRYEALVAPAPKTKQQPAPPPLKALSGKGGVQPAVDVSQLSMEEYRAYKRRLSQAG